jgi:hypothetical protein
MKENPGEQCSNDVDHRSAVAGYPDTVGDILLRMKQCSGNEAVDKMDDGFTNKLIPNFNRVLSANSYSFCPSLGCFRCWWKRPALKNPSYESSGITKVPSYKQPCGLVDVRE